MKFRVRNASLIYLVQMSLFALFVHPGNSGVVTDSLKTKLRSGVTTEVVLELPSVITSVIAHPLMTNISGFAKTTMLIRLLKQFTSESQAPFVSVLRKVRAEENIQTFWISNKISITNADISVVKDLSTIPGTFKLSEPHKVHLIETDQADYTKITTRPISTSPEWGVKQIDALAVWESGIKGQGVIVAGIDTGVRKIHEALKNNYAGGWYDAVWGKAEPYDDNSHGTHTMGTIVGQFGIGVAPEAKWVACKGLNENKIGTEMHLTECAQFVLNFKPTPNIVSNSWGVPGNNPFFNDQIAAWKEAGIIPVFALGNEKQKCGRVASPGDQPHVIGVGAMDKEDILGFLSSRGNRTDLFKPDLSAPGMNVISASAWGINSYQRKSATSCATPHVAGAVALMLSKNPHLIFDEILTKLGTTAYRPILSERLLECGKANGDWPNNAFGYGRINVWKAVQAITGI